MHFILVDVCEDSKCNITFIFCNDDTFQLRVRARDARLFVSGKYEISVTRNFLSDQRLLSSQFAYSNVGVVVRKTRNSVHIASGMTHWMFPRRVCSFNPGIDVWITAIGVNETQ